MKICLTGGIACGKSLLSHYLNELGVETIDADDIVHEILPDPAERRRIATEVFADPARRRALEARIHPIVCSRIAAFLSPPPVPSPAPARTRLAVIPLLFEVQWDGNFDIICCVVSSRENQIARMTTTRAMSRTEAEARLAAQMPVEEKARKSHYVIRNDGTSEELKSEAARFVAWLDREITKREAGESQHGRFT